jgi:hypothetical protein
MNLRKPYSDISRHSRCLSIINPQRKSIHLGLVTINLILVLKPVYFIALVLAFSGTVCVSAQPVVPAVRTVKAPLVNGLLDDEVWHLAQPITEFYQREPDQGKPVSEKTEVYILYDDDHLYFGFRCYDEPAKITAKEMARDISLGNDDRVQVIIDTHGDRRTAYWFQIGPRGSIGDAIVSDNGAYLNKEWDGLWTGKARILEYGWEAEIAIPFKTIGFDRANPQWGLKLIRNIIRKLEASYWPEANINTHRFQVSDAGILDGIEGITQGVGLDISPYLAGGIDTRRGIENDTRFTGGVDFFYQITPGLKSSLTINTDFAETEVDDRQINLTRFNIHFPEKRDFFLDGANYFQFGIETEQEGPVARRIIPFFSRRIGLDDNGASIPINYGGKLTGQFNNWNFGLLHINDDRGDDNKSFSVARISHNILKQSSVGVIGTYGNALGGVDNMLAGADLKLASSTFAGNKNISFLFFGLKSSSEEVKGRDGSWGTQFIYPNDLLKLRLGYHEIGRNFNAGVGFVPRTGIRETYGEVMVGPRPGKWGILQALTGISFDRIVSDINVLESQDIQLTPLKIRFISGEEIAFNINRQHENISRNFNIFRDIVIPTDSYSWWRRGVRMKTKGSRALWAESTLQWGDFYDGSKRDVMLGANWKVAVPLFLGARWQSSEVSLPQGNFTANIYQTSLNFLVSPEITLNNYIQYDNASELLGWQSRFQWIVKPGNEIILVWTSRYSNSPDKWQLQESSARIKLKYNIRF